ncbi:MAG: hypothetical protein R2772_11830 [Chitinophagales bacterium]
MNKIQKRVELNIKGLIITFLVCVLVILIPLLAFKNKLSHAHINRNTLFDTEYNKVMMLDYGPYQAIKWVNNNLSDNEKILVFRESDFAFYSNKHFAVDLDPKYIDLFQIQDIERLKSRLIDDNISYLLTVDYALPSIYNSSISDLISNPRYTEIIFSLFGYTIYRVGGNINNVAGLTLLDSWQFKEGLFNQEKWSVFNEAGIFQDGALYEKAKMLNLEARERLLGNEMKARRTVYSGRGIIDQAPSKGFRPADILPNHSYLFKSILSVEGPLEVHLHEYTQSGNYIGKSLIWSGTLHSETQEITAQFLTALNTAEYRVSFSVPSNTELGVYNVDIFQIDRSDIGQTDNRSKLWSLGWRLFAVDSKNSTDSVRTKDWGVISGQKSKTVFLRQQNRNPISIITPSIFPEFKIQSIEVRLRGEGYVRIDFLQAHDSDIVDKSIVLTENPADVYLLEDGAQTIDINFDNRMNQESFELRFELIRSKEYLGSQHEFAALYIEEITIKGTDTHGGQTQLKLLESTLN